MDSGKKVTTDRPHPLMYIMKLKPSKESPLSNLGDPKYPSRIEQSVTNHVQLQLSTLPWKSADLFFVWSTKDWNYRFCRRICAEFCHSNSSATGWKTPPTRFSASTTPPVAGKHQPLANPAMVVLEELLTRWGFSKRIHHGWLTYSLT